MRNNCHSISFDIFGILKHVKVLPVQKINLNKTLRKNKKKKERLKRLHPNSDASGQLNDSLWLFIFHQLKLKPSSQVGAGKLPGKTISIITIFGNSRKKNTGHASWKVMRKNKSCYSSTFFLPQLEQNALKQNTDYVLLVFK